MSFFPLFLEMKGRRVLVAGAGQVATRRILALERFGAELTVIAREASEPVKELAASGRLMLIEGEYEACRSRLQAEPPFFLVLAATGDEAADRAAQEDGRRMGAFVNVAGDRTRSDFYFPGLAEGGGLTVGIAGTGEDHGKTRDAAAAIRRLLEEGEQK